MAREQSEEAVVTRSDREAALLTVFPSLEAAGWLLREWVERGTMNNPPELAKAAAERSLPRLNKLAQLLASTRHEAERREREAVVQQIRLLSVEQRASSDRCMGFCVSRACYDFAASILRQLSDVIERGDHVNGA